MPSEAQKEIRPPKTHLPGIPPIFHGPVNVAGIPGTLSAYQRSVGLVSDSVVWAENPYFPNSDLFLTERNQKPRFLVYLILFLWSLIAVTKYQIFHFYSARTLWPFGLDLPILRLLRKKLIMTYCGSDIRLISEERHRNPYASLLKFGANHPAYDRRKKLRMRWQARWCHKIICVRNDVVYARSCVPTNKLIFDIWIPNIACSSDDCANQEDLKTSICPLLVHAPSKEEIKGTKYVREAIAELKARKVDFEYQELQGVLNTEARSIYREADVIIDQFLLGGIGTLAFEGMSYGKPVVAYILPQIVEEFMPDCPVVNTTIDELPDKLEALIRSPQRRLSIGRDGIAFVRKYLDRETVNQRMIDVYLSLFEKS